MSRALDRGVVVDRSLTAVQAVIADEQQLMQWSAWPQATGFTCAIDGDGRSLGSAIVFRDGKGVEQGRQRLTPVTPGPGLVPAAQPRPGRSGHDPRGRLPARARRPVPNRVHFDFRADVPLPAGLRHLAEAVMGRRVRALHVKDLETSRWAITRCASQACG